MKQKIFLGIAIVSNFLYVESMSRTLSDVDIIDYEESYQNVVMEIAFQDSYDFFVCRDAEKRKRFVTRLNDERGCKRLLRDMQRVVGFIIFNKKNVSSYRESGQILEIEALAVAREFRRKGYARALLQTAIQDSIHLWPHIKKVILIVNMHNEKAQQLYASEGFVASPEQPFYFRELNILQYEKGI